MKTYIFTNTYVLVKYVPIYGNTCQFMEIRTIFVKITYVFTASMYVLVLLLKACHIWSAQRQTEKCGYIDHYNFGSSSS